MSPVKALVALLLLYGLIGGSAAWRVREICLLVTSECGLQGLLQTVASDRLLLAGVALMFGALVYLTFVIVRQVRGTVPEPDPDTASFRLNVSGLAVAIIVVAVCLLATLLALADATSTYEWLSIERTDAIFWRISFATIGLLVVFHLLFIANDYFSRPAPILALALLIVAALSALRWLIKLAFA